jgi:hypothetical protein
MSKQISDVLTLKGMRILDNLETFKDQQILKSRSCKGSGDCKSCNLFDCYYNETEVRLVKRVYRCPNCDAIILTPNTYGAIHYCSCKAITHIKNWKIEFNEV